MSVHNTQHSRGFVHPARIILVVADRVDAIVASRPVQAVRRLGIESWVHWLHAHAPAGRAVPIILHHVEAVPRTRNRARLGHDARRTAASVGCAGEGCLFLEELVLLVATIQERTGHEGGDGGENTNHKAGYGALAETAASLVARVGYGGDGLDNNGARARNGLHRGDSRFGGCVGIIVARGGAAATRGFAVTAARCRRFRRGLPNID